MTNLMISNWSRVFRNQGIFYVHGTVHLNSISINVQQEASIHSLSVTCTTYFGWYLHSSSGAQITVSTASGASQPLLLPVGIERSWDLIATGSSNSWLAQDAVDTVICVPDDGWRDHSKYVEQFRDKLCMVMTFVVLVVFYEITNVDCVYWSDTTIYIYIYR